MGLWSWLWQRHGQKRRSGGRKGNSFKRWVNSPSSSISACLPPARIQQNDTHNWRNTRHYSWTSLKHFRKSQGGTSHKLFSLIKTIQNRCVSHTSPKLCLCWWLLLLQWHSLRQRGKTFLEFNFSEEVGSPENQLLVNKLLSAESRLCAVWAGLLWPRRFFVDLNAEILGIPVLLQNPQKQFHQE